MFTMDDRYKTSIKAMEALNRIRSNKRSPIMENKKVKIGVISDTHLDDFDEGIKRSVEEHFRDVDMILHAGDICVPRVLDEVHHAVGVVRDFPGWIVDCRFRRRCWCRQRSGWAARSG